MASRSSTVVVVVPHTPSVAGVVSVIPAARSKAATGAGPSWPPQGVRRAVKAVFDHRDGQSLFG
jgi:hypothetical protein